MTIMRDLAAKFEINIALPDLRGRILHAMQTYYGAPEEYHTVAEKVATILSTETAPDYSDRLAEAFVLNRDDARQLAWLNTMRSHGAVFERIDCAIPGTKATQMNVELVLLIHPAGNWEHAYGEEVAASYAIVIRIPNPILKRTLREAGKSLREGITLWEKR